jgi:transcription termination factor NusB
MAHRAVNPKELKKQISLFISKQENEPDYYSFTSEILIGLLHNRKYTLIGDRWIMGILDEHLQSELKLPELCILRVAAFELLTHPEIPTTVIINEVNTLSKIYCPNQQSLIHATVNRMIETQTTIGAEIKEAEGGDAEEVTGPPGIGAGLEPESQLALILLEQRKRKARRERRRRRRESSSESSRSPERPPIAPPVKPEPMRLMETPKREEDEDVDMGVRQVPQIQFKFNKEKKLVKINSSTQTVANPLTEPGIRVYKIKSV